jgi:putative tryptophan/tyrosine transport system substrate-binding protein
MSARMRRREFISVLGGVAVWPLSARGQQLGRYRIGYLALSPGENNTHMRPFVERLRELGLIEGKNIEIIYRSAEGNPERLPQLARELAELKPDVLVAGFGTLAAKAAKEATTTIPVVFLVVGDPLGAGIITNLARPGANVTGMSSQISDLGAKRLEVIQEIIPGIKRLAVLMNPQTPATALSLQELRSAALREQLELNVYKMTSGDQVSAQFEAASKVNEAIIVLEDPLIFSLRGELAELAFKYRPPALFAERSFVEAGGLVGFGPDRPAIFRHAAEYVERILKGAKPGNLPVQQPTDFELAINLRTARAMGLELPVSLLARADEVIE